jgi:hypothetical protein
MTPRRFLWTPPTEYTGAPPPESVPFMDLSVGQARDLYTELAKFLADEPEPPKPAAGELGASHGGDQSLMKPQRRRKP